MRSAFTVAGGQLNNKEHPKQERRTLSPHDSTQLQHVDDAMLSSA